MSASDETRVAIDDFASWNMGGSNGSVVALRGCAFDWRTPLDSNAVIVGVGLAVVIAGAIHFGWLQAMAYCEKLEAFNISIREWRAYTPERRTADTQAASDDAPSFAFRAARGAR
jgi:hypothetical protein